VFYVNGSAQTTNRGSSAKPSSASGSSRYSQKLKFVVCMHSHGVPNLPDPSPNGAAPGGPYNSFEGMWGGLDNDELGWLPARDLPFLAWQLQHLPHLRAVVCAGATVSKQSEKPRRGRRATTVRRGEFAGGSERHESGSVNFRSGAGIIRSVPVEHDGEPDQAAARGVAKGLVKLLASVTQSAQERLEEAGRVLIGGDQREHHVGAASRRQGPRSSGLQWGEPMAASGVEVRRRRGARGSFSDAALPNPA
jgi:hypothetical protein